MTIADNVRTNGHKYIVYGNDLGHVLGYANSFGECKELHKKWLQEKNDPRLESYAGLHCSGDYLKEGIAFPAFYEE